jgi:hypothetical protein
LYGPQTRLRRTTRHDTRSRLYGGYGQQQYQRQVRRAPGWSVAATTTRHKTCLMPMCVKSKGETVDRRFLWEYRKEKEEKRGTSYIVISSTRLCDDDDDMAVMGRHRHRRRGNPGKRQPRTKRCGDRPDPPLTISPLVLLRLQSWAETGESGYGRNSACSLWQAGPGCLS